MHSCIRRTAVRGHLEGPPGRMSHADMRYAAASGGRSIGLSEGLALRDWVRIAGALRIPETGLGYRTRHLFVCEALLLEACGGCTVEGS